MELKKSESQKTLLDAQIKEMEAEIASLQNEVKCLKSERVSLSESPTINLDLEASPVPINDKISPEPLELESPSKYLGKFIS